MSFKKFGQNDIIINTMMAEPQNEFFIFDGDVYYNDIPALSGSRNAQVRNVPVGYVSLYEYNIDRPDTSADNKIIGEDPSLDYDVFTKQQRNAGDPTTYVKDTGRIYPWISKDSAGASWQTVNPSGYATEYNYGDVLTGSYPLSSSISREFIAGGSTAPTYNSDAQDALYGKLTAVGTGPSGSLNKHYYSLKNRLNFYGVRSPHYKVSATIGASSWNKDIQALNLIAIPSIFFGSRIKPGTVSLKWYYTGSLAGELQDTKQNGELIQVSSSHGYGTNNGKVAGVIMYDEGYIILTGSWALNDQTTALDSSNQAPSWLRYGVGGNDGVAPSPSASFDLSFKGQTKTQVMTMFAHAKRGEANYSNNPTYLKYGQDKLQYTSSQIYEENSEQLIANTVSSSYNDYDAAFKRSVYISRVAIYDENKNMIGLATLANPVLKEEDEDFSFKIKLDI